jgi:YD repeat-containing protein
MRPLIIRRVLLFAAIALTSSLGIAQQQPNLEKGFHADKVYASGDIDHVNMFNGNLNLVIPIGQRYRISSALDYGFTLFYSGNNWETHYDILIGGHHIDPLTGQDVTTDQSRNWTIPYRRVNAGPGWNLSLGRLIIDVDQSTTCGCTLYQSPDGGEHQFYSTINGSNGDAAVLYTRDNTYLRMRLGPDAGHPNTAYFVDFPNGNIHEFDAAGRLIRMSDPFNDPVTNPLGNTVTVSYDGSGVPVTNADTCTGGSVTSWKIHESNRDHYIYFRSRPYYQDGAVCAADLSAFGQQRAVYRFNYDERVISRQFVGSETAAPTDIGNTTLVPLLTTITLPDGSFYQAAYDIGLRQTGTNTQGLPVYVGVSSDQPNDTAHQPNTLSNINNGLNPGSFTGHLTSLRLPTRATMRWTYHLYTFPSEEHHVTRDPPYDTAHGYRSAAAGVATRTIESEGSSVVWTYTSEGLADSVERVIAKNSVVDSVTGTKSSQYFAICRTCLREPYKPIEYGLAVDRRVTTGQGTNPVDGHYLSSTTEDSAGTILQRTYVSYEADSDGASANEILGPYDYNRRISGETTATINPDNSSTPDRATTNYSDFDGLGHYRTATTAGNFDSGNVRVETTAYNKPDSNADPTVVNSTPTSGTLVLPHGPWILNTFSSKSTTEASVTAKALFWFDTKTGFLKRQRTLASGTALSGNDTVGAYGYTLGNLTMEESYGGDQLPTTFLDGAAAEAGLDQSTPLSTMSLANAQYRLKHTYAAGSLATSRYYDVLRDTDMPFYSVDQTIDTNTGLASSSRDSAGSATTYNYDSSGRLTTLTSPGVTATTYTYTPATTSANARVDVATSPLASRIDYDDLGRVHYEWTKQPKWPDTSTWSVVETSLDVLGRKRSVSTAVASETLGTLPTFSHKTQFEYDALGRVKKVTAPDGAISETDYRGARSIVRTVRGLATGTTLPDATTTESYDRQGRLIGVDPGSGSSAAFAGYGYDVGGRLSTVGMGNQTRTFTYDNRGVLISETQPESGSTTWTYDARGHARTKKKPEQSRYDLKFFYDPAERLMRVMPRATWIYYSTSAPSPFVEGKEFVYGTENDGTNLKKGKLESSIRHNYNGTGDYRVLETYAYAGLGGRLSKKTTTVDRTDHTPAFLQKFEQGYAYDSLGEITTIDYPKCIDSTRPCGAAPWDQLTPTYNIGRLSTIPGFINKITYHANGMTNEILHANQVLDTQALDDSEMSRPKSIKFTPYAACTLPSITTPPGNVTIPRDTSTQLTVTATGASAYKWFDATAPGTPASTSQSFTTPSLTADHQYYVIAYNACGNARSDVITVTIQTCSTPTVVASPVDAPIESGSTATFSANPTGNPTSYQWYRSAGQQQIAGATASQYTTPALTETTSYYVVASNACGSATSPSVTARICNKPAISALTVAPVPYGQTAVLAPAITGTTTVHYVWFRGATGNINVLIGTDSPTLVTSPIFVTTRYWVRAFNGCGTTDGATIVVPVALSAPSNLVSSWTLTTGITLRWNPVLGADHYRVEKYADGVLSQTFTLVGVTFVDTNVIAGKTYVYRVKAFDSTEEGSSAFSAWDVATTMSFGLSSQISFTDLDQLLTAVNRIRAAAFDRTKSSPITWSNVMSAYSSPLPAQYVLVYADHLLALRGKMNEALQGAGVSPPGYSAVVASGAQITAEAWLEIQRRAQ